MALRLWRLLPRQLKDPLRRAPALLWQAADDLLRGFLMAVVLRLSADLLPRESALAVARWCGAVMLHIPSSGKSALATMKNAFLMDEVEAVRSAREYLSLPFISFVVYHRLLRGRERFDEWNIEEENSDEVRLLRRSGLSFIVATGHFARHAIVALYHERTTPGPLLASVGPFPDMKWEPSTIRIRVQYGQLLNGVRHLRPDAEFVFAGASGAGRKLLGHFRKPGATAIITADAFWDSESSQCLVRSFTGHHSHAFATGAATLGRLVQCPVIPCVPYFRSDGTLVFRWGMPIPPPDRSNKEADINNTNRIIDFLETEVGLRPTQYALYIGESRSWNAKLKQWEDPVELTVSGIPAQDLH